MSNADLSVQVSGTLDVDPPISAERLAEMLRGVLEREGISDAAVSVTLLGDEEISALNRDHLGHHGPTDVISFPLPGPGRALVGDVYLGADQIRRQAAELGVPPHEELLRVSIHGILHLLGYDHPAGEDRYDSPMFKRQEELLERFGM